MEGEIKMFGLVKLAEEKGYPGYSREDILREKLDNANDEYYGAEAKIPSDTRSEQSEAYRNRALSGLGLGAASGMATGALLMPKSRGAIFGGAGGGLLGLGIGSVLGNIKEEEILRQRNPEIAQELDEKQRQIDSAKARLYNHTHSYNPNLEIEKQRLALEQSKARHAREKEKDLKYEFRMY